MILDDARRQKLCARALRRETRLTVYPALSVINGLGVARRALLPRALGRELPGGSFGAIAFER